jgi:hypothetical protein
LWKNITIFEDFLWPPNRMGIADAFDRAFNPNRNGVANAFNPQTNGVANAFQQVGRALDPAQNGVQQFFENDVANAVSHIPGIGTILGAVGVVDPPANSPLNIFGGLGLPPRAPTPQPLPTIGLPIPPGGLPDLNRALPHPNMDSPSLEAGKALTYSYFSPVHSPPPTSNNKVLLYGGGAVVILVLILALKKK